MATVTETYTAELCSRTYGGTANRYPNASGTESPAATHGTYNGTSWVGMVRLPTKLTGMRIKAIKLRLTANTAGSTASKVVYIYSSNHQTTDAEGKGSIYPNALLGSIAGAFRNTTTEVSLGGDLLTSVAEYYAAGNQMLILYDPTDNTDNYCRFTTIEITVTYSNANTVMLKRDGVWKECEVYYRENGVYKQVTPYYRKNGVYHECTVE